MVTEEGVEYEVVPRLREQRCYAWRVDGGGEPRLLVPGGNGGDLPRALPSVQGWTFSGVQLLGGRTADVWTYELR